MTGQLIGTLILWLIVAVIVIAIIVYLVNWLYRRSSKEVSFVRTGLFGEKVVINGGAFVLPIIHDVTPVSMNVLRMAVTRAKYQPTLYDDERQRARAAPAQSRPAVQPGAVVAPRTGSQGSGR